MGVTANEGGESLYGAPKGRTKILHLSPWKLQGDKCKI